MVIRSAGLGGALLLCTGFCGCTDITEYSNVLEAGLHVVSAPDLTVTASFEGIRGGRSVCPMAGSVWVATTEGRILSFDTGTLQQDTSWTVGPSSPSSYSEMVFSPTENSVYLTGPYGTIIELACPDGAILDDFSVCEAPELLVVDDDGPFLYMVDAATDRILEVRLQSNHVTRSSQLQSPAVCLCNNDLRRDTLVLGTLDGARILSTTGTGILRSIQFDDALLLGVTGIPFDSIHCAVRRTAGSDQIVTLDVFFPDTLGGGSSWTGAVAIDGEIHRIAPGTDRVHAYVLSYVGGSTSRLVSYDFRECRVDATLDLPGYPMDMRMTPSGNLAVLTVD